MTPRETRLLKVIERFTGQKIAPMRMPSAADVAARRASLFKAQLRGAARDEGLEPYLSLVEELAEEAGLDMAEIAAAAAKLARAGKPFEVVAEPLEPAPAVPSPTERGMVRLFIDAGRDAGVRPADIVGTVAGEADIPGQAIGAIDIYDRFTFVDVAAEYGGQVLERMRRVKIRNRPVTVKMAAPKGDEPPRARRPRGKTGVWRAGGRRGGPKRRRAA